jgi:hypothetical protein
MAYTPVVENAKESIVRSYVGTKSWLNGIENLSTSMDDAEIQVGTNEISVVDAMVAATVANKTGTAVIADKGANHKIAATTVYKYLPVKFFDSELATMTRLGVLNSELDKIMRKATDGIYATVSATLVDALTDGALTLTATLPSAFASKEFAAGSEANQVANMTTFGSTFGQVAADNNGNLPDWCIATTTAFGNLTGYSANARGAVPAAPGMPTTFMLRGVPFWAQGNGTAAKWGDVSVPCLFMGSNRHLVYRLNRVAVNGDIEFETATGLWVLPLGFTYTYCVDFTGTTGLALGIGEVLSGTS